MSEKVVYQKQNTYFTKYQILKNKLYLKVIFYILVIHAASQQRQTLHRVFNVFIYCRIVTTPRLFRASNRVIVKNKEEWSLTLATDLRVLDRL